MFSAISCSIDNVPNQSCGFYSCLFKTFTRTSVSPVPAESLTGRNFMKCSFTDILFSSDDKSTNRIVNESCSM